MAQTWTKLTGPFPRSMRCAQNTTEAAPTAAEGVRLHDLGSVHALGSILAVVQAPSGQTFTGTGALLAYVYVESLAAWVRAPQADYDCGDLAGLEMAALPALQVVSASGIFNYIPDGVGLSAGSTMTIDYIFAVR